MARQNRGQKKEKKPSKIRKNQIKKNKGKKMFWNQEETPGAKVTPQKKKKSWFGTGTLTKPTVSQDPDTLMCVLYSQKTLDEIAAICKPQAGGSEFQVHYRGAQFIITQEGSNQRIAFTIPTCFFNMTQSVSAASVDFNLDEVDEISQTIAPISMEMVKDIADAFPIEFFKNQGFNVQVKELEMGSIHRHPGDFGFSATDLDNQVEKPGVIFRNRGCTDQLQVDSVMYIPGDRVKIVTTETRGVTVKTSDDGGIEGQYLESPTIHYILQDSTTSRGFHGFFGGEEQSKTTHTFTVAQKWIQEKYPDMQQVIDAFLDAYEYEPKLFVDPSLITQERAYYNANYNYNTRKTYTQPARKDYGNTYDENEYVDDFYKVKHDPVTAVLPGVTSTGTPVTPEERRALSRPKWRRTQTTALLRAKKINLLDFPDIDGSGMDKDIIAIVQSLKGINYDDIAIRNFFTGCGYPPEAMGIYYSALANTKKVIPVDVKPETPTK